MITLQHLKSFIKYLLKPHILLRPNQYSIRPTRRPHLLTSIINSRPIIILISRQKFYLPFQIKPQNVLLFALIKLIPAQKLIKNLLGLQNLLSTFLQVYILLNFAPSNLVWIILIIYIINSKVHISEKYSIIAIPSKPKLFFKALKSFLVNFFNTVQSFIILFLSAFQMTAYKTQSAIKNLHPNQTSSLIPKCPSHKTRLHLIRFHLRNLILHTFLSKNYNKNT